MMTSQTHIEDNANGARSIGAMSSDSPQFIDRTYEPDNAIPTASSEQLLNEIRADESNPFGQAAESRPAIASRIAPERWHPGFTSNRNGSSDGDIFEDVSNETLREKLPRSSGPLAPPSYNPPAKRSNSHPLTINTLLAERPAETFPAAPVLHVADVEEQVPVDEDLSALAAVASVRRNTGALVSPTPVVEAEATPSPQEVHFADQVFLVPRSKESRWTKLRKPVAAFLLFSAVGAVGYLGYDWMFSASGRVTGRQSVTSTENRSNAPASGVAQPVVAPTPTSETTVNNRGTAPSDSQSTATPTGTTDPGAHYSLQAASFSNEADARSFSEKLVRVGVPAYIVSADVPKRGRWFRVRVGSFPTAEEANRYIVQSKQRAKTAGITLDLIVCDYEKP
jgi:cell division septation protein DedD